MTPLEAASSGGTARTTGRNASAKLLAPHHLEAGPGRVDGYTFTSTRPLGSASARTTSSVISVGTLEAGFGQHTQTAPAG